MPATRVRRRTRFGTTTDTNENDDNGAPHISCMPRGRVEEREASDDRRAQQQSTMSAETAKTARPPRPQDAKTAKTAKRTETAKSAKCDMKSWQAVRRLFSKLY